MSHNINNVRADIGVMPTRFITWNVKGMNGPNKRGKIFSHLKRLNAEIIFLSKSDLIVFIKTVFDVTSKDDVASSNRSRFAFFNNDRALETFFLSQLDKCMYGESIFFSSLTTVSPLV